MFGGADPFDPFGTRRHMRQMEQMMDSMMAESFGNMNSFFPGPMMGMLENSDNSRSQRRRQNNQIASPFGFGSGGIFGNMMSQMQMFENQAANDPHSHVFSQSTMISYDGSGAPKVVSKSVRKSGDVKETRHQIRDGEREEITVGHAIGDREHIIEKKRDRDGRVRKNQKFVNLDEDEAEHFNNEFKSRAHRNISNLFGGDATSSRHHAIENGRSSRHSPSVAALNNDEMEHSGRPRHAPKKESQPIIEIPDDDDDDIIDVTPANNHRVTYSNSRSGPRISEVTDDVDGSSSKRRKGMFGKFFANDD
jgi:hypothetical protein